MFRLSKFEEMCTGFAALGRTSPKFLAGSQVSISCAHLLNAAPLRGEA